VVAEAITFAVKTATKGITWAEDDVHEPKEQHDEVDEYCVSLHVSPGLVRGLIGRARSRSTLFAHGSSDQDWLQCVGVTSHGLSSLREESCLPFNC